MASKSGGDEADSYQVRQVQDGIIETIFSVLPTEQQERKQEQDRRRKFKEKLLANHRDELIIDSSYVTSDGKHEQTHTDTLLGTDNLEWWQEKVEETYGEDYLQDNKPLNGGHKIVFKDNEGEKFLTFSFYPGRKKLMAQGSHADLSTWIKKYAELRKNINMASGDNSKPVTHDDDDAEVAKTQVPASTEMEKSAGCDEANEDPASLSSTVTLEGATSADVTPVDTGSSSLAASDAAEGASGPVIDLQSDTTDGKSSDDVSITGSDHVLFHSPTAPVADNLVQDEELITPSFSTSMKTYAAHHRQKSRASFSTKKITSALARESTYVLRVKQRMDALDAIVSGLQGGIMKLVDSVDGYKEKTEQTVLQVSENISSLIKEKQPTPRKGNIPIDNKPVLDAMNDLQKKMVNKLAVLTERITQLEQGASQLKRVGKLELMMENLTAQIQTDQGRHCASCNCSRDSTSLNSDIQSIREELRQRSIKSEEDLVTLQQTVTHAENTSRQMNEKILKVLQDKETNDVQMHTSKHSHATQTRSADPENAGVAAFSRPVPPPPTATTSATINVGIPADASRLVDTHAPSASARSILTGSPNRHNATLKKRKVLLMGDSTIKAIDKRYLLHRETVSKCRAATVSEALEKMKTGSKQEMNNIILCVGLNDLRQGTEVKQIARDMKSLVEETTYRHPNSYIYICSILPVNSPEITRDSITRLNTELENLQRHWERVFYVNTISSFLNHDTPWLLFEKDRVHPSKMGVTLLTSIIRKKVQTQQESFHRFTSKRATPSTLSYASCVMGENASNKTSVTSSDVQGNKLCDIRLSHPASTRDINRDARSPLPYRCEPRPPWQTSDTVPSRLDSVDCHLNSHRDNVIRLGRGPMYMPHQPSSLPPMYPYTRYYSQMRPDAHAPWQGHSIYPHMGTPYVHHPRETSEMMHFDKYLYGL